MGPRPYSVALLADVHGNLAALRAVLDDLRRIPHDRLVVAGDLARGGPRPAETLDVLRSLGPTATMIYGSADRAVADPTAIEPGTRWVQQAIGPAQMVWLAGLPFDCRITPPAASRPATTCSSSTPRRRTSRRCSRWSRTGRACWR
jgi:hypothetical protein